MTDIERRYIVPIMKAYHGSTAYDVIKKFKRSKTGALGPGIYFTTDIKVAKEYALQYGHGNIYTAELDVKNPLHVYSFSDPASEILSPALHRRRVAANVNYCHYIKGSDLKKLQAKGYDAIIMRDEIMVFTPEQIKILDVQPVDYKEEK